MQPDSNANDEDMSEEEAELDVEPLIARGLLRWIDLDEEWRRTVPTPIGLLAYEADTIARQT